MKLNKRKIMFFNGLSSIDSDLFQQPIIENQRDACNQRMPQMLNVEDLIRSIPSNLIELERTVVDAITQADAAIGSIIAVPRESRTFANTILAADEAKARFQDVSYRFEFVLTWLHPEAEMRKEATNKLKVLNEYFQDKFVYNTDLFHAYKEYAEGYGANEDLSDTQLYGMHRIIHDLQKLGVHLTGEKLENLTVLKKEIDQLATQYTQNWNNEEYKPKFSVSKEELAGVPEDLINRLARDGEKYVLTSDANVAIQVLQTCHLEETRKKMYLAFRNMGMPVNEEVLKQIVQKYNELAFKLGFTSFAQMDTSGTMAKNPEAIKSFISSVILAAKPKWLKEKALILENLPDTVTLFKDEQNGTEKLKIWDLNYIFNELKKKLYNVDEQRIKKYFPIDETIAKLFNLYEEFMDIKIREIKVDGLWHEDVRTLEVFDSKDELCGYIFLDLKKRQNKQGHFCCSTFSRGYKRLDGTSQPSACVVTTSLNDQLLHSEVKQFFHEFGHGLHAMLGRNEFASLCGMFTAPDFSEMPSQLLEEWMFQGSVLKRISSHCESGEALPNDLIESIIEARNFDQGNFTLNQMTYALASLEFYLNGHNDDLHSLMLKIRSTLRDDIYFDANDHMEYGWFHITNPLYLSKYYGYMYSSVFAQDLFHHIQENGGVFNATIGKKYVDCILQHGGSKDPTEMLANFLGREPNIDAFMKNLDANFEISK